MELKKFIKTTIREYLNEKLNTNNIIAYHGTRYNFDEFDVFYPKGAIGNPKGAYFTRDLQTAIEYAENVDGGLDDKSRVVKVKLNIDSEDDGEIINRSYSGEEIIMYNLNKIQILDKNVLEKNKTKRL
jgi:hypothetical protein